MRKHACLIRSTQATVALWISLLAATFCGAAETADAEASIAKATAGLLKNSHFAGRRDEQEISRQARQDGSLGLLLLDLDHFKEVNDTYGHAAGDLALCAAARVLGGVMRAYDHAARWGGEEFLILLPDCSETDLLAIAERLRARIEALKIDNGQHQFSFTVSIGAHLPQTMQTPDAMLQQVDRALYAAKAAGRNCVRLSSKPEEDMP